MDTTGPQRPPEEKSPGPVQTTGPDIATPPREELMAPVPAPVPQEDSISPASKQLADDADREGHFEIRQRLVDSKMARREAEDERKKIANRIQMLRVEEQKVPVAG